MSCYQLLGQLDASNIRGIQLLLQEHRIMISLIQTYLIVPPFFPSNSIQTAVSYEPSIAAHKLRVRRSLKSLLCHARRRVVYDDNDDEEEEETYGHNAEIEMLELYSQSVKDEALLVNAVVDEQQVEVVIFKGFSSCLSYRTSPDPSKSVLPARAVIKCIDRIKGPFDPSNINYLEKGLTVEAIKARILP